MRAFVRHDFREEENISVQYHSISVSLTYPRISYQIAYMGISYYVSIINQTWIFYIYNLCDWKQLICIWIIIFYVLCNISIYTTIQINWPTSPINPSILSLKGKHFCLWQLLSLCWKQIANYIIFCQTQCCTEVLWFGFFRVFSYQDQEVKSPQRRIGIIIGTPS